MAPLIEAIDVSRRYGRGPTAATALAGVTLQVERGEYVAVEGPSGSGKSTLMNIVGFLDAPTGGALRFRGEDASRITSDERAVIRNRHVGFVFQAYHLLSGRSARGNVEMPLLYAGVPAPERRRRAEAALESVGLAGRYEAFPGELSGGEQQRVAIARALVTEPDLVLADEPTGALDSATGLEILKLLEHAPATGRTLLLVTHDRELAARARRRVSLADGVVVNDRLAGPAS